MLRKEIQYVRCKYLNCYDAEISKYINGTESCSRKGNKNKWQFDVWQKEGQLTISKDKDLTILNHIF